MKFFILINHFPELIAEVFKLSACVFTLHTFTLETLNLSVFVLNDIVQSLDLSSSHLNFEFILVNFNGGLS